VDRIINTCRVNGNTVSGECSECGEIFRLEFRRKFPKPWVAIGKEFKRHYKSNHEQTHNGWRTVRL